jgi:YegS/Rv2252/BmrU family lipid kinase
MAGAGKTARRWPRIVEMMKSLGLRFDHHITEAPGHAIELAREAVQKGCDQVVSVGGDGTINEVANGLYHAGANGDVRLGIIGTGTGGDYVRTVGLPRHHHEMCRCLLNGRPRKVDVGIVEYTRDGATHQRLFVNFAGAGFDAEIVRRTTLQYKSLGSTGSYLMGLLATLLCYGNRRVTLNVDGEAAEEKVCTVIMNNGRYGGGGMLTAPGADLEDGLLDVLTVGNLNKADLIWSLPRIYRGTHLTHPKVAMRQAREIEMKSERPTPLQADGELLGELPARFRILPSALNIVVQAPGA